MAFRRVTMLHQLMKFAKYSLFNTRFMPEILAAYMGSTTSTRGSLSGYTDEELEQYLRDQGMIRLRC